MGTLGQIQDDAEIVATPTAGARFMPLAAAGAALGCSPAQAYSLVCHGDLPAIRLAGCGEWRVERAILEQYLRLASGLTRERATTRPLGYPPAAQRPTCVIGFGGRLRELGAASRATGRPAPVSLPPTSPRPAPQHGT